MGAAVVPPFRGVGAAGRRPGSLPDQPLPHAIGTGGLAGGLFAAVEQQPGVRGVLAKHGSLADAILVEAQVRCSRGGVTGGSRPRDPDAAWARRGPHARFGYKLHLGVDADSELVRRAVLTPANLNETQVADGLIAGGDAAVYGDAAYGTHALSALLRARYRSLARNATRCGSCCWPTTCVTRAGCRPAPPRRTRRRAPSPRRGGLDDGLGGRCLVLIQASAPMRVPGADPGRCSARIN